MSKISMPVEVDLEDLAISLNHKDGLKLIEMINNSVHDLQFTEDCFKYFSRMLHSFYRAYPESGSINNLLREIND